MEWLAQVLQLLCVILPFHSDNVFLHCFIYYQVYVIRSIPGAHELMSTRLTGAARCRLVSSMAAL